MTSSPARRPSARKQAGAPLRQRQSQQPPKRNYAVRQLVATIIVALIGSALGFSAGIVAAEVYPTDTAEIPPLEHWFQVPAKLTGRLRPPQQPTITLPSDNLFADSKSRLRAEGLLILNEVAEELAAYSTAKVMIAVHTDNVGEAVDDRQLSLMRARAVQLYL
ncbi:MAG: OmpA family protein, partial [Cyanobacteria bacterium]|nr:OmpA family protein [Cyanobacteriota bacterium]